MGSKKKAALHGATKKERKALEKRAAELEAEIERREKKAAKKALANSDRVIAAEKAKKKGKGKKANPEPAKKIDRSKVKKAKAVAAEPGPIGVDASIVITAEAEAHVEPGAPSDVDESPAEKTAAAARAVLAGNSTDAARADAEDALAAALEANPGESVDEIKARVKAKREARAAGVDTDAAAKPGSKERLAKMQADVAADHGAKVKVRTKDLPPADPDAHVLDTRKKTKPAATSNVDKGGLVADAEAHAIAAAAAAADAIETAIEAVETETGTIYAAGPSVAATDEPLFAKPSEAPKSDFESNGNGQYLVMRPDDGKLVGYTRVTSYIRGIEDDSAITKWKLRVLLEGAAAAEEMGDAVTARVRDLVHNRDLAIAKARKSDRKGKLAAGELATWIEGAWRDFKRELDKLAEEMIELGGGREKAAKGTDLHALFELHDTEGMQAVADLATLGQITPADLADVEARAELVAAWGIRFVDVERVVVNDAVPAPTPSKPGRVIGVAGRLDRTGYVKLPGETRARKRVIDDKTGSTLDYSKAEISRQLASYAMSKGYDLDTHEREDLKLDQKTAIVIHTPAGSGKSELYAVDLVAGRKGLKIIADMRANRNEGKGAMTLVEHEKSVD